MLPKEANRGLRDYICEAVRAQVAATGRAVPEIKDSDCLADLGIDSMGVLRLYVKLQEFPGVDITRIAEEAPPERVGDFVALGMRAMVSAGA
jgi:acyl carrier protein